MPKSTLSKIFTTTLQVVAALCLAAYFVLLFHKGNIDIAALAEKYPAEEFWPALGRHFIRSLGGG